MDRPLILMSSITNAMKGRDILKSHGIRCEIERMPKNLSRKGCGYCLYVPERTDEAERLLAASGIKTGGRAERGIRNDLSG